MSQEQLAQFIPYLTVIVAIVGVIGTVLAVAIKGFYDLALSKRKFEADLVLKAITDDSDQSKSNLTFLLRVGLLDDKSGKFREVVNDKSTKIRIPNAIPIELGYDANASIVRSAGEEIIKKMSVTRPLSFRERPVKDVFAAKTKEGFEIVFDPEIIDDFRRRSGSNWSIYGVLAREMGHVHLGHLDDINKFHSSRREIEMEAYRWAGLTLARLGASEAEALIAISTIGQVQETIMPEWSLEAILSVADRVAATKAGWFQEGQTD